MSDFLKYLFIACVCSVLVLIAAANGTAQGFVEGQLNIAPLSPVQLSDESGRIAAPRNYGDYPLVVLTQTERKSVARVSVDVDGNFRAALPPGDYVFDVEGRGPRRLHVNSQPFTIVAGQTIRANVKVTSYAQESSGRGD